MKIFALDDAAKIRTFIFDIDGTLYTSKKYVREQVDVQIRHFAKIRGMTENEAQKKIENFRDEWSRTHGGKKISLGNAFTFFGVDIETSIRWRNELLQPEKFLTEDLRLKNSLERLKKKFNLICVTNNPVEAARKTLAAVGIEKIIPEIIGLDTFKKSKPSREMILAAMEKTASRNFECVAVGDRFDIDLALPIEMGMAGILVDGAEDVCRLTEIFL